MFAAVLQDVLENEHIKLENMFKFSLIQDLVRVSISKIICVKNDFPIIYLSMTDKYNIQIGVNQFTKINSKFLILNKILFPLLKRRIRINY